MEPVFALLIRRFRGAATRRVGVEAAEHTGTMEIPEQPFFVTRWRPSRDGEAEPGQSDAMAKPSQELKLSLELSLELSLSLSLSLELELELSLSLSLLLLLLLKLSLPLTPPLLPTQGHARPHTSTPSPQSIATPLHTISHPPSGHRTSHPLVALQVVRQSPPTQSTSHPPVPLHTISDALPTRNEHGSVPLHTAVQSAPHAPVHPVPLHVVAHPSPHVVTHRSSPVHVHDAPTQMQPKPPALHVGGPPGFGGELPQAMRAEHAIESSSRRVMTGRIGHFPQLTEQGSGIDRQLEKVVPRAHFGVDQLSMLNTIRELSRRGRRLRRPHRDRDDPPAAHVRAVGARRHDRAGHGVQVGRKRVRRPTGTRSSRERLGGREVHRGGIPPEPPRFQPAACYLRRDEEPAACPAGLSRARIDGVRMSLAGAGRGGRRARLRACADLRHRV
jgi:hypothetical protein